jgi:competence protein ComEA
MPQEVEIIDFSQNKEGNSFNLDEFLLKNRTTLIFAFLGIILAGVGIFFLRGDFDSKGSSKVEVLTPASDMAGQEIVVEVSGAVEKPGVYKFKAGSRVDDALIASGGLSASADRDWVSKMLNRAAKLTDGQKIFIPDKQSQGASANKNGVYQNVSRVLGEKNEGLININTASAKELDSLPGIGQVYAQKIIEQRPYSNLEELVSKKVLPQSTYEKIKDKITVW